MRNKFFTLYKNIAVATAAIFLILAAFITNSQQNEVFDLTVSIETAAHVSSDYSVQIAGFSAGGINQTKPLDGATSVVFVGMPADTYDVFVSTPSGEVVLKSVVELNSKKEVVLSASNSQK